MKKILFIFFALLSIGAFAQPYKTVVATEADVNNNAETDYIYLPNYKTATPTANWFFEVKDLDIQVLCTQEGGTSDGKITLERSLDRTSWKPVLTTVDTDLICLNDTFTITNAAVLHFRLKTYWPYYRLKIVGTSSDSTSFTTQYAW